MEQNRKYHNLFTRGRGRAGWGRIGKKTPCIWDYHCAHINLRLSSCTHPEEEYIPHIPRKTYFVHDQPSQKLSFRFLSSPRFCFTRICACIVWRKDQVNTCRLVSLIKEILSAASSCPSKLLLIFFYNNNKDMEKPLYVFSYSYLESVLVVWNLEQHRSQS